MRLAVIGDEVSQDLDEVIRVCRANGFSGIEVRSVWNVPPHELSPAQCVEIGERIRAAGLEVAALSSPTFKTALPQSDRDIRASEALLCGAVDRCHALGTSMLRVFAFYRDGDEPRPEAAAEKMGEVLARVEIGGIDVVVETGTRTNAPTATHLRRLLDALGHDRLGALWDPGNSVFAGFASGPVPTGLADFRPGELRHLHVKDPDGRRAYVELGTGDIDWPRLLRALVDSGYRGWASLETHWRLGRELSSAERDDPWGTGFSSGGLEASERCMATLAGWVAAIEPEPYAFRALHHVLVSMPRGKEEQARAFYGDALGMREVPKPPVLAERGGVWFRTGGVELHIGVEDDFRPALKAHPAFRLDGLEGLADRLAAAGVPVRWDPNLPGHRRFYVHDPFGNRLEFLEPESPAGAPGARA